jgi:hypothetical protein
MNRLGLTCVLAVSFLAASTFAQQPAVKVSFNGGGRFTAGNEVSISITLKNGNKPGTLPRGSMEPTAFYQACSVPNLKDNPGTSPEVFCDTAENTKLIQSSNDTLPSFTSKAGESYTFKQPFKIPQHSPNTRIWVVVFLNYQLAGQSHRLYGSANLTEHCETAASHSKVAGKVDCAFYTAGAWASKKTASSVQTGTPVSPNP